jgi:hypothetical protein
MFEDINENSLRTHLKIIIRQLIEEPIDFFFSFGDQIWWLKLEIKKIETN